MQSRETQITKVKWTNAGGQTKPANERSFVYRPPAWRRWRNVKTTYIDILFAVGKLNHRYIKNKTRENWNKLTFSWKIFDHRVASLHVFSSKMSFWSCNKKRPAPQEKRRFSLAKFPRVCEWVCALGSLSIMGLIFICWKIAWWPRRVHISRYCVRFHV